MPNLFIPTLPKKLLKEAKELEEKELAQLGTKQEEEIPDGNLQVDQEGKLSEVPHWSQFTGEY